jgi:hypothetical protein
MAVVVAAHHLELDERVAIKHARLRQEQVERLKRGLLGQKAERLPKNDAQLSFAIDSLSLAS